MGHGRRDLRGRHRPPRVGRLERRDRAQAPGPRWRGGPLRRGMLGGHRGRCRRRGDVYLWCVWPSLTPSPFVARRPLTTPDWSLLRDRQGRAGHPDAVGTDVRLCTAGERAHGRCTLGHTARQHAGRLSRYIWAHGALQRRGPDRLIQTADEISLCPTRPGAPSLRSDPSRLAGVLAVVASSSSSTAEVLWAHSTPSMVVAYQTSAAVAATVVVSRAFPGSHADALVLGGQSIARLADVDEDRHPQPKRPRH